MVKNFRYDDVPVVQTKAGKLKGYAFDEMYIFNGIPYAEAKRFQMPIEVTPWEGVKEAASYGFVAPLLTKDHPTGEILVPHRYWPTDENCLNLNIWTESLQADAKKPVMVWLHGGGYTAGSSIEHVAYDGFAMSRHGDVVVVSINHRLNILGYMDLSPFGEKYANSANSGHADLVAALQWIQENIVNFGGDPDNVTIFGQSGGGMKVTGLMQIPSANGLFHKGIIMSGVSDGTLLSAGKGNGTKIITALLNELGIAESDVEQLETVPYYELAEAYLKVSPALAKEGHYVGCAPLINDYYVGEPLISGYTEHAKTIPLLMGSVYGEFTFAPFPYNKSEMTDEDMQAVLTEKFGERAQELIDLFTKAYPYKKIIDVLTLDQVFRQPTKALAKLHAEAGQSPAYLYNFTLDFPYQNGKTAWHCADIPFVFHNTDKVPVCNIPGVSERLEKQVFQAFINFAYSGNPNHDGLPNWPVVTVGEEPTMMLDRNCYVTINYDDALLALLGELTSPSSLEDLSADEIQH